MSESLRLVGNAARDLLDVAGDVGELDAKTADAVGKLINESFGQRPVGSGVQYCKLCDGNIRVSSSRSRSSAQRGIPHSHSNFKA